MVHIDDLILLEDVQIALGIFSSYVTRWPSYLKWIILPSSSFLFLLASFDKRVMQVCGDIMGPKSWEFFQGLLVMHQAQLPIFFGGIGLLYGRLCPIYFFRELGFSGFVFVF